MTTITTTETRRWQADAGLPDEMLERFRSRAAGLDQRNEYFHDDLQELRDIGYLAAAVPVEHGGWGLSLAELTRSQRRLARYAPATALAVTMHSYWVGIAQELDGWGDTSLHWQFDAAARGEVFAAGHAEAGNDIPVLLSSAHAERVEGGYRITGRKQFGSNGPVWSWLGAHALVPDAPGGPQVVHAFVERTSPGVTVVETWDTLGMRPTQSHDTILDGVFVPDERIGRVAPAGDGSDPFLVAMAIWPAAADRRGVPRHRRPGAGAGRGLGEAQDVDGHRPWRLRLPPDGPAPGRRDVPGLEAASMTFERFVDDWTAAVDHGDAWVPKVYAMKWHAVEAAKRVVDRALDVSGGAGMFRSSELERLYRDVRCGGFHPGNDALTHELVGKALLGVLEDQPRW